MSTQKELRGETTNLDYIFDESLLSWAAIHKASERGHENVVSILVNAKADVNSKTEDG